MSVKPSETESPQNVVGTAGELLLMPPRPQPRAAHQTARPSRRHTDIDVDIDRRGVGRVRDVDVDVDVHRHGRHRSVDVDVDVDRRRGLGAVAVGVAIGTTVARLPRRCTTVVTDDVTYHHCDGVYYRLYYKGTKVVYIVVDEP